MSAPILIIDDDDVVRSELAQLLTGAGHSVVETAGGDAALEFLTSPKQPPSLIILDLKMPGLNGHQLLDVLESYLRLSVIPVVVLSGAEPVGLGVRPQVVRYLRKPIDDALLLSIVRAYTELPSEKARRKRLAVTDSVH